MNGRFARFTVLLRKHSVETVRSCIRNCECLCAYKLHRAQQIYRSFWGVPRSRSLLKALKVRTFLLGASSLAVFNWDAERIADKVLTDAYRDIDQVKQLVQDTLTCRSCGKRLVADIPAPGIQYCTCATKSIAQGVPGGWIPFIERKDLLVWRRECKARPGLFEYKLYGRYPEVTADIFLQVQIDPDYRTIWDASAIQVRVIDHDPVTNSHILYWEMKWPTFFSNRDYVYNRRYVVDNNDKVMVIHSQATSHPDVPECSKNYRVKEYWCTMVIKPLTRFDQPGVEFCMTYFDNPGLSLPTAIQTWVATSAMPDFLNRLRHASSNYAHRGLTCKACKTDPHVFQVINKAVSVS